MKNMAIARRYAKALLLIGKQDGETDTYRDEIEKVSQLIDENPELGQALTNPLYNAEGRKKVLLAVLEQLGPSKVMQSFIRLLFDKGRIGLLGAIADYYAAFADELKEIARATLTSAVALSDEAVDKIRAALAKRTGKEIILDIKEDPSLIGGIVTTIGDLVLDGSVKTQLANMRESLTRGERA